MAVVECVKLHGFGIRSHRYYAANAACFSLPAQPTYALVKITSPSKNNGHQAGCSSGSLKKSAGRALSSRANSGSLPLFDVNAGSEIIPSSRARILLAEEIPAAIN